MAEGREPYRIEVAQRTSAFQVFENDFSYFRVLPACRNPDGTKRNMSMKELNEAVQMWMNRAPTNGPVWDNLDAALAEKGAEITWLKEYQNVHMTRIIELEDRIAELEKLSTMQKATIDSLGKELLKAEKAVKCDGCHPKPCSGCRWENERCKYRPYAKGGHSCRYFEEPQKKEPELFICPNSGIKPGCDHCDHRVPHQHKGKPCEDHLCGMPCSICKGVGCKCIPYKEPSQTPAPEEGKSPIQHLQDRVLELEQHQGRDRADLMEKIRELERDGGCLLERLDTIDEDFTNTANIVFKLKDQIKGLEHRLGLAQDRIAEIHPSGCVPPAKSKPKSRLKTDRMKKVK